MFKIVLVNLCIAAFVIVNARPNSGQGTTPAVIISQNDVSNPDGSFSNDFETSDGIKVQNSGTIKRVVVPVQEGPDGKSIPEHEEEVLVHSGSYTYTDPEGQVITLTYVADENGFQPQGDHLPVPQQL